MKGVIATRAPQVAVVDVSHGVPPQDVLAGALVLRAAVPFFPPDTVHVAVVDPGVGTTRRVLCLETDRGILLGPDNGVLSLAAESTGVRSATHVTDEALFLTPRSRTFHGRDVFAPVAAHLALGGSPRQLGRAIEDWVRCSLPPVTRDGDTLLGEIIYVDHFGNLVTNLPAALLPAVRPLAVSITGRPIGMLVDSYAAVPAGSVLAIVNSWDLVEIAVREGSATNLLGASKGTRISLAPA